MAKGVFDKRFTTHIPASTALSSLLCTNELGYVEADTNYVIHGVPQETYLFGYTTEGKGKLIYKDTEYELKENSLFCINCLFSHEYRTSQSTWKFYWFHMVGKPAANLFKSYDADVIVRENIQHFHTYWENLYSLASSNSLAVDLQIAPILNTVLNTLFVEEKTDIRMQKTEEYIHSHYTEKLTIDDMAKNACMSKYHFSRLFKECTGESPYKYLCMYRIEKAKDLLIATSLTVAEIAIRTGFEDVSSFIYLFKKHVSVSPLQFRKHYNTLF